MSYNLGLYLWHIWLAVWLTGQCAWTAYRWRDASDRTRAYLGAACALVLSLMILHLITRIAGLLAK